MSASQDITSPSSSSGLGGDAVSGCFPGREGSSACWVGSPDALSSASGGLPEGMRAFCGGFAPSRAKGFFYVTGVAGFPEVDGRTVPRLGSIDEAGLENFTFFFFPEDGVTHS